MGKYYVIVAGSGSTSRANVEALLDDYFYTNGKDGILVVLFKDKPAQAQVFASQFANDKSKPVLIYSNTEEVGGLSKGTLYASEDPLQSLINDMKDEQVEVFLLWSDEDSFCTDTLDTFTKEGVPCFDLTDGLCTLVGNAKAKVTKDPEIPEAERLEPKQEEVIELEEEVVAPIDIDGLESKTVSELREMLDDYEVDASKMKKSALIETLHLIHQDEVKSKKSDLSEDDLILAKDILTGLRAFAKLLSQELKEIG